MKLNTRLILEALTAEQHARLGRYEDLLRGRAIPLGLVSARDSSRLWERHIADSLRGAKVAVSDGRLVDIGSGAGLPGIPIAISRPDCRVSLVERNQRSAAFLELAVDELALENVEVIARPAESLSTVAGACLARAIDPDSAWRMAAPILSSSGFLLYWAGRTWGSSERTGVPKEGVVWEVFAAPEFPWQGPLVIMKPSLFEDDGAG